MMWPPEQCESCAGTGKYMMQQNIEEELHDALVLILPMAKGYAHANQVGGNMKKIQRAESIIAKAEGR